jgi:uncharacterized damage-inducible protein DinB
LHHFVLIKDGIVSDSWPVQLSDTILFVVEDKMEEPFDAYLSLFETLHQGLMRAIDGLPTEALDWVPGAEMNSIAVLLVHTAGSQRYWVGDVVGAKPSGRERSAEFVVRGLTSDDLRQRLAAVLDHTRQVVGRLTTEDLGAMRSSTDGREHSVSWALMHALEHTAQHLGHIQLTRQLWEQRQ